MPDLDFHCEPAPAQTTAPPEAAAKTIVIDRNGGKKRTVLIALALIIALLGGLGFTLVKHFGGGAATAMAEVVSDDDASPDGEPTAIVKSDAPAECAGDIADPQLRWYCSEFLPFAKKAAADHDRLDRLEATGGGSGAPLGLWLLVIGIGVVTVLNTVLLLSRTPGKKPNG